MKKFASLEEYLILYDELRGDKNFMLKVLKQYPNAYNVCDYTLQQDPDILRLTKGDFRFESIPFIALKNEQREKYDIAMKAITSDIRDLLFVPYTSPDYEHILLSAIEVDVNAINFVHPKYNNVDVINKGKVLAITKNIDIAGSILRDERKSGKHTREFHLAAALTYGWIDYAYNTDREIILAALHNSSKKGTALDVISPDLYDDKEIAYAILSSGAMLKFVKKELLDKALSHFSYEELLQVLKKQGQHLEYISSLCDDDDAVLSAVSSNGAAITFASDRLQKHPNIIRAAICSAPKVYKFLSNTVDYDMAMIAVEKNGKNLNYVPHLQRSRDLIIRAVRNYGLALQYEINACSDRDVVIEAVKNNGIALQYASMQLRCDPEVVMEAVTQNPAAIKYAGYKCRNNPDIFLKVISADGSFIEHSEIYASNIYSILVAKKTCPNINIKNLDKMMLNVLSFKI